MQGAVGKTLMNRVGRDPDDLSTLVVLEPMHSIASHPDLGRWSSRKELVVYDRSDAVLRVDRFEPSVAEEVN